MLAAYQPMSLKRLKCKWLIIPACLLVQLLAGCGSGEELPRGYVIIGQKRFSVEIAATPGARSVGLMHRKDLPADNGMIFIFEHPEKLTFWMKDTYISLDIAFISDNMTIINTATMPALTRQHFFSAQAALLAVELPAGTLEKYSLGSGDKLIAGPKVLKALATISDK